MNIYCFVIFFFYITIGISKSLHSQRLRGAVVGQGCWKTQGGSASHGPTRGRLYGVDKVPLPSSA